MTSKLFDYKIWTFKILLLWRFPRKNNQRFGRFSSLPPCPPPQKPNCQFSFSLSTPPTAHIKEVNLHIPDFQGPGLTGLVEGIACRGLSNFCGNLRSCRFASQGTPLGSRTPLRKLPREKTTLYHLPRKHYPINSEKNSNRVTVIKNNSTRTGVPTG